jgi:lauroyl/myristoyl acyltransferase
MGANLASALKIASMDDARVWRHVTFEVAPGYFPESDAEDNGRVCVTAHLSNWELLALLPRRFPDFRFGAVYRGMKDRRLNDHLHAVRARTGLKLFDRKDGFWAVATFVKSGGLVGLLVDQHAGRSGLALPFFGRPASVSTMPGLLAKRTGAKLATISVTTTGLARWRISLGPPHHPTRSPKEAAAQINIELERLISEAPADWLWSHNRWKHPPLTPQ